MDRKSSQTKDMSNRGKLIVIEGTDGSGKATQTGLLIERLRRNGRPVETMSFPRYGTPACMPVEAYLGGELGPVDRIGAKTASLLFAIDQWSAKPTTLDGWLEAGRTVVLDRYVSSNMGHQGSKIDDPTDRAEFFRWLDRLEFGRLALPRPDLCVILHVPADLTAMLIERRGRTKDAHESDLGHLRAAELTYLEIASCSDSFRLIECVDSENRILSPETIHRSVWQAVEPVLAYQKNPVNK